MGVYGILPMAGKGSRIQPIGFSKELYPVAFNHKHFAISEFSIQALKKAKVDEIRLVLHPDKLDIARYYASYSAPISMYFKRSKSLPESCFYPLTSLAPDDICLFGLPDTLFSPITGFKSLRKKIEDGADLVLGLFCVEEPEKYDSVEINGNGRVLQVKVKESPALSDKIWGIWGGRVKVIRELEKIVMSQKGRKERLLGVGFNELIQSEKVNVESVYIGDNYFDIGTMESVVRVREVMEKFSL